MVRRLKVTEFGSIDVETARLVQAHLVLERDRLRTVAATF